MTGNIAFGLMLKDLQHSIEQHKLHPDHESYKLVQYDLKQVIRYTHGKYIIGEQYVRGNLFARSLSQGDQTVFYTWLEHAELPFTADGLGGWVLQVYENGVLK